MEFAREAPVTEHRLDIVAARLLEAACSALEGNGPATRAHITRALHLLQNKLEQPRSLLESPQRDSTGALSTWRAQRVTAHIEAHLASSIRVRDLASLVGLSNSYFCHAFKRRYGLTVHVYLTCRRIELAQRLMLATTDSLSDIALSCGMSDQAHFTRAFRRVVGETPNRWRQAQRAALSEVPAATPPAPTPVLRCRDDIPGQASL